MRTFSDEELARLEKLPYWPAIQSRSCGAVWLEVLRGWKGLLAGGGSEAEYHSYLAANAGFFFPDRFRPDPLVLSKIRLGSEFETDFVLCTDQRSLGFMYDFIEIEVPHVAPFTKHGDPSARLTHALQQVDNWRRWLEANRQEAKRLFPSDLFIRKDSPSFNFVVVIGNSENSEQWLDRRNELARKLGVSIRSFDFFTYCATHLQFNFIARRLMSYKELDVETLHEMANPFYQALGDAAWKEIRNDYRFQSSVHMLESNAELITSRRTLSERHKEFLELWSEIPRQEAEHYRRFIPVGG